MKGKGFNPPQGRKKRKRPSLNKARDRGLESRKPKKIERNSELRRKKKMLRSKDASRESTTEPRRKEVSIKK